MAKTSKKRIVSPSHLTDGEKKQIIDFIASHADSSIKDICEHMFIDIEDQNPDFIAVKHFLVEALDQDLIVRDKTQSKYRVEQNIGYIVARYIKPQHPRQPVQFKPITWPENAHHNKPAFIALDRSRKSPLNPYRLDDGALVTLKVNTSRKKRENIAFKGIVSTTPDTELTGLIEKNMNDEFFITPVNGSRDYRFYLRESDLGPAKEGDIVNFKLDSKTFSSQTNSPSIISVLGQKLDWHSISPVVASEFKLSQTFNEKVMSEMQSLKDPNWTTANRTDLTAIPYVTIDDVTTTDMDDAIYSKPVYNDKGKQTGWFISVAIADVAQYIAAGSAIDREAEARGNTNYLPGFRCDMVPTEIATDKASLVPDEIRSALVMNMNISLDGRLQSYKLQRGLIKSRAKLHHQQVEDAINGNPDSEILPHMEHIKNMYAAFKPLAEQSEKRRKLPIESKEQKIAFDAEGNFVDIVLKDYMEINKVIEEYMVLANMCAAKILKAKGYPAPHRNHGSPSEKRMMINAAILEELGYPLDIDETPEGIRYQLVGILKKSKDTPEMELVHQLVTMLQARAEYSTDEEVGHYGLGLEDYAHFTSPIRRYADLDVHRKLISACNLGTDGLPKSTSAEKVQAMAEHISERENIAKRAEREARARFCQAWINREVSHAYKTGKSNEYEAIITDISEGGIQVKLARNGVEGFIPVELLPGDGSYRYIKDFKLLVSRFEVGRRTYENAYQQGARLTVAIPNPVDKTVQKGDFEPVDFSMALLPKYENEIAGIMSRTFDAQYDRKQRKKLKRKTRNHKKGHIIK